MFSVQSLPVKCIRCNNCKTSQVQFINTTSHFRHANKKTLCCNQCEFVWDVCMVHHIRFLQDSTACEAHFSHCVPAAVINDIIAPIAPNDIETTLPMFTAISASSMKFFNDEATTKGLGLQGIVGRAFAKNASNFPTTSLPEVVWQLQMTHFITQLTQKQQEAFVHLLDSSHTISFLTTRWPTNLLDVRAFYTHNKLSIKQNIPCDHCNEINNHAYVSITSIVEHCLAHGIANDNFFLHGNETSFNAMHATPAHKNIVNDVEAQYIPNSMKPLILHMTLWQDDFEANHTRKNRNSTWLKTLTLSPPAHDMHSSLYTHAIALGRKGHDHGCVNVLQNKEIKELKKIKLRYYTPLKKTYQYQYK